MKPEHEIQHGAAGDARCEIRPGGVDILPYGGDAVIAAGEETPCAESQSQETESCGFRQDADTPARRRFSLGAFTLIGWAVCLFAVLWLFSLASPFLSCALVTTGWRFYASLALAALPFVAVIAILAYALLRFRRVPAAAQFDAAKMSKSRLRKEISAKYLRAFPPPEKYVAANGFSESARPQVLECLRRLSGLAETSYSDSGGWFEEFLRFQRFQDERADEIISRHWKLVGIQTAVSPWKIVDMVAVVHNSTAMIVSLASLYNRRTSPQAAFRLACRWIFNIFAAGELGEAASSAANSGADSAASSLNLAAAWLVPVVKPVTTIAGKVAEGAGNAALIWRLGRKAVASFRPLARAGAR